MALKNKLLLVAGILLIIFIIVALPYYNFVNKSLSISPLKTIFSNGLLEKYDNQVGILLLGVSGDSTHDGEYLSDSIIAINYNLSTNKLTTISIPRDIWSSTLRDKINSAYAYGGYAKNKRVFNPNDGMTLAKAEVQDIVGFPLQYAAVVNFQGFEKLINYFGGVDITVDRSFTDNKYPLSGKENDLCGGDLEYKCRYETISFTKGPLHLDGTTALKFVRSRYSQSEEGTDFARELRQQKVIEALKNKIITALKKLDINQYKNLYAIFNEIVNRDISNQQASIIVKNILIKGNFTQQKAALNEDLFINPPISSKYDGMWVLIPATNNYDQVHQFVQCVLKQGQSCKMIKTPTPTI